MAKSSRAQVAVLPARKPIAEIAVHVLVRMTEVVVVIAMTVVHEMIAVVATIATIVHVQTIVRARTIEMAAMLRQMQSA